MEFLLILITLLPIGVISYYSAIILSQWLPDIFACLNRKPFNCTPCLTFHFSWLLSLATALIGGDMSFFFIGLLFSVVVFFIVKYIDNQKIVK